MKKYIKSILIKIIPILDILLMPWILISASLLYFVRRVGIQRMRFSKKIFDKIGVFPIIDHYYEPLFNHRHLRYSLEKDRLLPGIDLNIQEQLNILNNFDYNSELINIPLHKTDKLEYYYYNNIFPSGDGEYLYNIIRYYKPNKMIEVGAGISTLMAMRAIKANKSVMPEYSCTHICIEPFECKWLESLNIELIRNICEQIEISVFTQLQENDILFIDSSHIIRSQGDVLFLFLTVLPKLKKGVLVHIHDIFTPRDYPDDWIRDKVFFWNEQYLFEAFMTFNNNYKIMGSLNYLCHNHYDKLIEKCPILKNAPNKGPSSLWMIKN